MIPGKRTLTACVLFASMCCGAAQATDFQWIYQTIDSYNAGKFSKAVIDNAGKVQVAYCQPYTNLSSGGIRLATWTPAARKWEIEYISRSAGFASLDQSTSGVPHVSYTDIDQGTFMHLAKSGGAWTRETLDPGIGEISRDTSIKVDRQGRIHISYYNRLHADGSYALALKYAFYDGSTWRYSMVDDSMTTDGGSGKSNSLALDLDGRPAIAYHNQAAPDNQIRGDLRFATLDDNGNWTHQHVDGDGRLSYYAGNQVSLAFGTGNIPHMSYLTDEPGDNLRYAYWDNVSSTWKTVVVTGSGHVNASTTLLEPPYTSITVNSRNEVLIAYWLETAGELRLATWDRIPGHAWEIVVVDGGGVGASCSLVLDQYGNPNISYWDYTNGWLKIARGIAPVPGIDPGWRTTDPAPYVNLDPDGDGLAAADEARLGTSSSDPDSDDDGWLDGMEAAYGSDPLDVGSLPVRTVLFADNLSSSGISWNYHDEGGLGTPGQWSTSGGSMVQTAGVFDYWALTNRKIPPGTMASQGNSAWNNFDYHLLIGTPDNGYIGLMFRRQDSSNFYLLAIDSRTNRATLFKRLNGVETLLGQTDAPFSRSVMHRISISAQGNRLIAKLAGVQLFDVTDSQSPILTGGIGFYTSLLRSATFRQPIVLGQPVEQPGGGGEGGGGSAGSGAGTSLNLSQSFFACSTGDASRSEGGGFPGLELLLIFSPPLLLKRFGHRSVRGSILRLLRS